MLRYPPSRIGLTSDDLLTFDQRFAARRPPYLSDNARSNVRLSHVPSNSIRRATTPVGQATQLRQASTSGSQATVCDLSDDHPEESSESVPWTVATPTEVALRAEQHKALSIEAANALESVVRRRLSPQRRDHGHVLASTDGPTYAAELAGPSSFDGTNEVDRRLLSSARARRRHARSELEQVAEVELATEDDQLASIRELQHQQHTFRAASDGTDNLRWQNVVARTAPLNPALDPDAPVFMPRTRFGSVVGSSADYGNDLLAPNGHATNRQGSSDLRLRPPSEQNIEPHHRQRPTVAPGLGPTTPREIPAAPPLAQQSNPHAHRTRRGSSVASNENVHPPRLSPNLERYPLLRPPGHQRPRRSSDSSHQASLPRRVSSGLRLRSETQLRLVSGASNAGTIYEVRAVPSILFDRDGVDPSELLRAPSSTFSTSSSCSTPNLLHPNTVPRTQSRGSSMAHRIPSIVGAASGISSSRNSSQHNTSRQPSRDNLDAVTEFLRQRSSPLSELSDRLSRLLTAQQRSYGRSWSRAILNTPRDSLLNGDPFRQESPPASPPNEPDTRFGSSEQDDDHAGVDPAALPSSSPVHESFSQLPSTPPQLPNTPSHRQPLGRLSPAKAQASPSTRGISSPQRATEATATPKVRIYNDSLPPTTQPQTPADVARSRHAHIRSESPVTHSTSRHNFNGRSPPTISERHPHRSTYPSGTPSQAAAAPIMRRVDSARTPHTRRRTQSHEAENALEAQIGGLEHDRRIWLGRRSEEGSMDITPPATGRYEQFLNQ